MSRRDYLTRPGQKDYHNMRSNYRHNSPPDREPRQDDYPTYGNYNPAQGTYENRADNLPADSEFMDQGFRNEYQQDLSFGRQQTPSHSARYSERDRLSQQRNAEYRRAEGRGYAYNGDDSRNDVRWNESQGPTRAERGGGYEPQGYRTSSYQSESEGNYQNRQSPGPRMGQQQGRHAGKGPKGYKRSEERIKEEASERLAEDSYIDASNIEVLIEDNCLVLRGTVEDRQTKRAAEDCVHGISGVTDVRNELRVNPSGTSLMDASDSGSSTSPGRGESARSERSAGSSNSKKSMQ